MAVAAGHGQVQSLGHGEAEAVPEREAAVIFWCPRGAGRRDVLRSTDGVLGGERLHGQPGVKKVRLQDVQPSPVAAFGARYNTSVMFGADPPSYIELWPRGMIYIWIMC